MPSGLDATKWIWKIGTSPKGKSGDVSNCSRRISLLKAEQAILTKYRGNWNIEDKL
jgi:hypothetical protein